jgi:hypothetical protein
VLLTYQGAALAAVTIDSKWVPNKALECLKAYGTSSLEHPAVQMVAMERGKFYMGELFLWGGSRGLLLCVCVSGGGVLRRAAGPWCTMCRV